MLDLNNKVNNGGTTAAGQLDADEWNQLPSEVQSAIESADITLSGGDLTQLTKSIAHYSSAGQFFTGGGIADAYTAAVVSPRIAPESLKDGMEIGMIIPASNTGASTLNAFGTGAVDIKMEGGTVNPSAALLVSGKIAKLAYRTAPSAHWELILHKSNQVDTDAGVDDSTFITPSKLRFGFSILLANTGYIVFPSWMVGFILQWGTVASSGTAPFNATVTLPLVFPTAGLQGFSVMHGNGSLGDHTTQTSTITTTEIPITIQKDGAIISGQSARWWAIGH